jgi:serine/threonine protein kinase
VERNALMFKSQNQKCDKCGVGLAAYATEGFCSACLLEQGLSAPASAAAPPISRFADYELIEEIARGGMGVVYRARQVSLDRIVAVKMILSGQFASPAELQRFRAEARAVATLQHPNIVGIHEVGECDGQPFFSMDFVEGRNLADLIQDGPWMSTRVARCVCDIAQAIHYAHEHGVLHRDLKPSNVLIDSTGTPRVTDFGLAKHLPSSGRETQNAELTVSGQVLGSPNFMPPEQVGEFPEAVLAADLNGDGRSDLISANTEDRTVTVLFNTPPPQAIFTGNGTGLTHLSADAITGGLTTNIAMLVPGGGTAVLCFTNGILRAVQ